MVPSGGAIVLSKASLVGGARVASVASARFWRTAGVGWTRISPLGDRRSVAGSTPPARSSVPGSVESVVVDDTLSVVEVVSACSDRVDGGAEPVSAAVVVGLGDDAGATWIEGVAAHDAGAAAVTSTAARAMRLRRAPVTAEA